MAAGMGELASVCVECYTDHRRGDVMGGGGQNVTQQGSLAAPLTKTVSYSCVVPN